MKNTVLLRLLCALSLASFFATAFAQNTTAPDTTAPTTPAAQPNPHARWEKEIAAFEEADKKQFPPKGAVLFIGSSSIRMWKKLAEDFPKHKVLNRGFGGSQIADSTHFADRIVFPYEPKMIVFFAGGNDINAKKEPEQIFADFKAFVEKVRTKLPNTKIAFISIPGAPVRWGQVEKIKKADAMIEAFTKEQPNLAFINIFPLMLDDKGMPREELYLKDRLHMNADGYAIWKKAVEPFLPQE